MLLPKLSNIPTHNLLEEFLTYRDLVNSPSFRVQITRVGMGAIDTPLLTWYGNSNDLLTLFLQRAFFGLESYICSAVYIEKGVRGELTKNLNEEIRDPFRIKIKPADKPQKGEASTVIRYYNVLPMYMLDESISLRKNDPDLWDAANEVYRKVRNPLAHNQQLTDANLDHIIPVFDVVQHIYSWIDTWHPLEIRDLRPRYLGLSSEDATFVAQMHTTNPHRPTSDTISRALPDVQEFMGLSTTDHVKLGWRIKGDDRIQELRMPIREARKLHHYLQQAMSRLQPDISED